MYALLLASIALLGLPAPASASQVGSATLTPDSLSVNATRNTLVFQFTATTSLSSGGTITMTVPTGSSFGENDAGNCGTYNDDCQVWDETKGTNGSPASWSAGSGTSLTIGAPFNISAGDVVVVTIANTMNGSTVGAAGYSIKTGSDTTAVTFPFQTLVASTSVASASVTPDSLSVNATRNTIVYQFTATGGLTWGAQINSSGSLASVADSSTITLTVPAGSSFGENGAGNCGTYNDDCQVWDETKGTNGSAASWSAGSGTSLTINVPMNISAGDVVVVTIANTTNGSTPGSAGYSVATSSDPTAVTFATQQLIAQTSVTNTTLTASSLAANATGVALTADFTATNALTWAAQINSSGSLFSVADPSTITLSAPPGSAFAENTADNCGPGNVDCVVFDKTKNTMANASWSAGSGTTLTINVPNLASNISAGDVVQVTIIGLHNPGTTGDGSGFSVWTSSDPGSAGLIANGPVLSVTIAGAGSGSVGDGGSLTCSAGPCTQSYKAGATVTLTAVARPGSVFAGWTGVLGCSTSAVCMVTVSAATNLTATFSPPSYTLSVTKNGTGSGTVTSTPAGIDCGATCSASYTSGTMVTLTPAASAGSTFTGWSGACNSTTCTVNMSQVRNVTATFTLNAYTLSVTESGLGTVTSTPAGIACGTTCSANYSYGTTVILTATASPGSAFVGWSGAGCSGTGACQVTISGAQTVTATFTPSAYTLTITKAGTGSGTVTSTPAGIDCGATCSASYASANMVTLTATASPGSTFAGWSGSCTGTATCTVTISAARNVTATFTLVIVSVRLYCGKQHRGLCLGIEVKVRFASPGNAVWYFDLYNASPASGASDATLRSVTLGKVARHVRKPGTVTFVFRFPAVPLARALKQHLRTLRVRTTFTATTGRPATLTRVLNVRL